MGGRVDKPCEMEDSNIGPTENMAVSVLAMGEGFHNYHHTFPYDYSTSEWGGSYNVTTLFIEAMAAIGQAYDLRRARPETIMARVARTGCQNKLPSLKMDQSEKSFKNCKQLS